MLLPPKYFPQDAGSLNLADVRKLLTRDNPLILEIGSNIGQSTIELVTAFPHATVICFEPEPRANAQFKQNVTSPNVTLFEMAIGSINGTISFNQSDGDGIYKDWNQSGSIKAPKLLKNLWPDVKFESKIEVPIVRLDNFTAQNGIEMVDFIWADVQGAEGDLIRGGERTLSNTTCFYTEYYSEEIYEGQLTLDDICKSVFDLNLVLYRKFEADALFVNKTHLDLSTLYFRSI